MWVTQTYLGTVEPDAKVFVYYCFEDYSRGQKEFTKRVQRELEHLGEVFGDKVSLLMPNPRYAGRIESEVRENEALWTSLSGGKLPGLLLSKVPLVKLDNERDECFFIPFETHDPKGVANVIQEVRRLAGDTLNWEFANRPPQVQRKGLGERFFDALELKPGIWGFKIDLRKFAGY